MTIFVDLLLAVLFGGIMAVMATLIAAIMARIIMADIEAMKEKTYIITKDGEKIKFNEEDQE